MTPSARFALTRPTYLQPPALPWAWAIAQRARPLPSRHCFSLPPVHSPLVPVACADALLPPIGPIVDEV